jgi:hypothetical protein
MLWANITRITKLSACNCVHGKNNRQVLCQTYERTTSHMLPPTLLPPPPLHPQEARTLHQQLTSTRTALKQADVRIAILEERILALQQVRTVLVCGGGQPCGERGWGSQCVCVCVGGGGGRPWGHAMCKPG